MRRVAGFVLVAVLATALAACGEDGVCSRPDGGGCYPVPDPSGEGPNDADEDFVVNQALSVVQVNDLAELAVETSDDVSVTELAEVYAPQADELLDDLQDWQEAWDLDPALYDSRASTSLSVAVPQYAGDDDYAVLEDLSGSEFDESWTEVMLERTEAQISAAEDILEEGSHPELRAAAQQWLAANEAFLDGLEVLEIEIR